MVSAYFPPPASAGETGHPHSGLPEPHMHPHQNAHAHHRTQSQEQEQKQETNRRNAASKLAALQQQMQQLQRQHENLSTKNTLALSKAAKHSNEQKEKRHELLNQMNKLAKQISDIDHRNKQHHNDKTKTTKSFSRSTSFMILQLEKVTAENRQAVIDEANKNRELKAINDKLFTQLDELTAENARLAVDASISNEQLLAENELLLHQSDQLSSQIAHANEQLKMKNDQMSEQLNKLAALVTTADKLDEDLNEVHSALNKQSRKRGVHELQDSNHDATCDVMDQYTKCCVCLEPYEVEKGASSENRLPIKSATCSHTLCEGCVDNCFASLLADGKSNVRYVTCPQCRTKRAFDVQNKVVDCFLREYIMRRCDGNAVSRRRLKSKVMGKTITEETLDESKALGKTTATDTEETDESETMGKTITEETGESKTMGKTITDETDEIISVSSSTSGDLLDSPTVRQSMAETTMWDAGF